MTQEEMNALAANSAATKKTYTDIYNGTAVIVSVEPRPLRFTNGLTEEEINNSMDIEIVVAPSDPSIGNQTITETLSPRIRTFKSGFSATESEMAIKELAAQKLIADGDPSQVFDRVGAEVSINVYNETSAKGTFRRCRFNNAKPKLEMSEMRRRIAALTGKAASTPAPTPASANPFMW